MGIGARRYALVTAMTMVAALGACSGGNDPASGGSAGGGEALEVDNCTLLTSDEVSALAGEQLNVTEDGPLGCAYVRPGEVVGQFSIRSYRQPGDAAAAASKLAPSLQVIRINGVGDDAVALADSDESVNFLIAHKGDLFVELVMTFLDITPNSPALAKAGQLASTALARLADAA